jgi:hypothetical protein
VISGWQEAYLGDFEHLLVGCMSGVTPTLDSRELTQGEIVQVVLTEGLAQQGSAPAESSAIIMRGMPSQVEVVAALKLPSAEGVHTNEAQHRSKDGTPLAMLQPLGLWGVVLLLDGEWPWLKPARGRHPR